MVREFPCCLCPALSNNFLKEVCPNCEYAVTYVDDRGWEYFVRAGLGLNTYKTFYRKDGKKGAHGCRMTDWTDSFMEAQKELNELAKKKGWKEKERDCS